MKKISEKTSGEQIIVKDIKDLAINVESKFNQIFTVGLTGEYTFAELMQKCYFSGCAEALHKFASSKMASGASALADLIVQCAGDAGLREWSEVAQETCTHNEAVPVRRHEIKTYVQLSCETASAEQLEKRLCEAFANPVVDNLKDTPEMVVSVLSLCPLNSIYDLKWFFPNVQATRTE